MSGPILKFETKQTVNGRLKAALEKFEGDLQAVVNNEGVTRGRVDSIERVLGGFVSLPLRYRLKWLLFGMPKPPKPAEPEPVKVEPGVH